MKRVAVVLLFFSSIGEAELHPVVWFNQGLRPLVVEPASRSDLFSQDCRSCHRAIYDDWRKSRHAIAWDNEIFQEGYLVEPQARCIFCHAPMKQQFEEIRSKKGGVLKHEGVNCAVCHIREKTIFSPNRTGDAFHPFVKNAELKSPQFCAGCHQFNFNQQINGQMVLGPMVVQNTYREWEQYRKGGGTKTCQNCHMPEGRHIFRGAHDLEYLSRALSIQYERKEGHYRFQFRPVGVGHTFPTGDLFRHLTFEVKEPNDNDYRVSYTFGREYALKIDPATGAARQELIQDTSMRPFRSTRVEVRLRAPFSYRVRYHYSSARNELMSRLSPEKYVKVIQSGEVRE